MATNTGNMDSVFYAAPAATRTDLNPLDTQLAQSFGGSEVWDMVSASFRTLSSIPDKIQATIDAMYASIAQTMADGRLNEGAKAADEAAAKEKAAGAIEQLQATAQAARDQVLAVLEPILTGGALITKKNPDAALFIEQRRDSWTGARMILDAIQDTGRLVSRVTAMAKTAAEARDSALQSALRMWAGAYLEARGVTYAPEVLRRMFDEAMAPALSPRQRAAQVIREELERGWGNLTAAFSQAQNTCKRKNWMRADGLPGWLPGSTIRI